MRSKLNHYMLRNATHSLDKALHLLWDIKLKYGTALCECWQSMVVVACLRCTCGCSCCAQPARQ
jgi:catalase (peroxidase I)